MNSPAFSLNSADAKKIIKGLFIAVLGAVAVYALQTIPSIDFGTYTPIVVAISGTVCNLIIKYVQGQPKLETPTITEIELVPENPDSTVVTVNEVKE